MTTAKSALNVSVGAFTKKTMSVGGKNENMTVNEIKQHAFDNRYPEEDMTAEEEAFYNIMWRIYRLYQQGALTKDIAEGMTAQALQNYKDLKFVHDEYIKDGHRVAELFKNVEIAATKFTKEPSIAHGFDMLAAIYGKNMIQRRDPI